MRLGVNALFFSLFVTVMAAAQGSGMEPDASGEILLRQPSPKTHFSVEEALKVRQSVRDFVDQPVTLEAIGQLLWAAQGATSSGRRTTPSAGALYPLEVYVVAGDVTGLGAGVYKYHPRGHTLSLHEPGDLRDRLAYAALRQESVADGAAVLVITAVYQRTAVKYGSRAERYVHMEVGHAAQNVYLQAQSLGLGTVILGAFQDQEVQRVLGLPEYEAPLALMPVGHPE
jgi:SagB-type dehydrogenase family enzyme